jgi:phosphoserine phosphatase
MLYKKNGGRKEDLEPRTMVRYMYRQNWTQGEEVAKTAQIMWKNNLMLCDRPINSNNGICSSWMESLHHEFMVCIKCLHFSGRYMVIILFIFILLDFQNPLLSYLENYLLKHLENGTKCLIASLTVMFYFLKISHFLKFIFWLSPILVFTSE